MNETKNCKWPKRISASRGIRFVFRFLCNLISNSKEVLD